MKQAPLSLVTPITSQVSSDQGVASASYQLFFRTIERFLAPLGQEKAFALANNQVVAANIEGLTFDSSKVSHASVEYLIQRVTTSTGATELIEAGSFHVVFKPTSNTWVLVTMWTPGPDASGVTLSITSAGQVQYTSSPITGTASISKITWRSRTLAAKHSSYSAVGR